MSIWTQELCRDLDVSGCVNLLHVNVINKIVERHSGKIRDRHDKKKVDMDTNVWHNGGDDYCYLCGIS